ncbi:MAG TPA: SsrA-binding protein, partial [Anaerolineales bacterium]
MTEDGIKVVARNRKAQHEYFLDDRFEAGLVLRGTEIKSIRAGQVSLQEAYVVMEAGEAWLLGAHVAPYEPASSANHD